MKSCFKTLIIMAAISLLLPAHAYSKETARDCAQFTDALSKAICASSQLSGYDFEIRRLYMRTALMSQKFGSTKERTKYFANANIEGYQTLAQRMRSECPDFDTHCIANIYIEKIALLKKLELPYDVIPDQRTTRRVCEYAIDDGAKEKANLTTIDINNDGALDQDVTQSAGSAHVPMIAFKNSRGEKIALNKVGYEWKDFGAFELRNFIFEGISFTLHMDEDKNPLFVSYVSPNNNSYPLCEYSLTRSIAYAENTQNETGLCKKVLENAEDLKVLHFLRDGVPENIDETTYRTFAFEGAAKSSLPTFGGVVRTDIDNDASPDCVARLDIASGSGRGCDDTFLKMMSKDCKAYGAKEDSSFAFLPEQRTCDGMSIQVLEDGNKRFIEFFKHNYASNKDETRILPQRVDVIEGGKQETVCEYTNVIRPFVSVIR